MKSQINLNKLFGEKRKYLIIFLFCGVLLMLLPYPKEKNEYDNHTEQLFSLEKEETRLEELISNIQGVGKCRVLLSVNAGAENILAEDEGETVVLSSGGTQSTVTVQTQYPAFQGAIIVIGGYQDSEVRFDVLSSVMAYTGLGTDRIIICPIKE